jgi:hypothetical protein
MHREPAATRPRVPRARLLLLALIASITTYLSLTSMVAIGDPFQVVAVWYLIPGAIVVLRRDGHVIGWLLVINGLLWALHSASEPTAVGLAWMAVPWRAWTYEWVGFAQWVSTVAMFVLFPNGLTDRTLAERRTARVMIGVAVTATVAAMFVNPVASEFPGGLQPNPTGLGFLPPAVGQLLILPVGVAGIYAVVGLWRRSRHVTGVRRRQYRWVRFAFAVVMVGLLIGLTLHRVIGDAAWLLIIAGWFLIPAAFSIAILRYRLYDIDRIVSRTVAYALITVAVAAIYAVPVIALPELFDLRGPLPVAAATLAAAAAFSPIRRVVQREVDRRFNRARFDARRELDAFATRLRSEVDLDMVASDLQAVVARTLQPGVLSTWFRGTAVRR